MQRVSLVLVLLATSSFLSAANAATARTASSRTCPRSRSNDALLDLCPAIEPTDDDLNQALFPEVPLLINAESGENDIKQQQQQQQAPLGILDTTEPLVVGSVVDNYIDNAVVTQQDENIITLSEPVTASADLDSPVLLSTSTLLQPETLMTESSTIATGKTHADQQQQQQQKPKTQGPLLSFEEWQRRVLQTEDENRWHMKRKPVGKGRGYGSAGRQVIDSVEGGIADDLGVMFETGESQPAANIYDEKEYIEPSRSSSNSPGKDKSKPAKKQFADVPIKSLKERFNYASIDCAATVRGANKEAKGAQSILYESKDQYMLNKCSAKKYVIINLCEAVLIDTIVMANFEFFSSTFSDFRVWVADRYPTKDWQLLGQWQARNTRDLQVFKVENPIRWFEFIKIEFLSHYGHEYYCPLSLVRVHGMPMMEYYNLVERKGLSGDLDDDDLLEDEYLWPAEVREEIIRPKVDALNESDASPMVPENEEDDDMRVQLPIIPPVSDIKDQDIPDAPLEEADQSFLEAEASTVQKEQQQTQQQGSQQPTHIESKGSSSKEDGLEHSEIGSSVILQDSTAETTATTRLQEPVPADSSPNSSPSVMAQNDDTSISATSDTVTDETTQAVPMTPSTTASSNNIVPPTNNANGAHTNDESGVNKGVSAKPVHANKEGGGGYTQESIYKTIMKRLNALELNATLSQRYLDEQNKMLNDMFMSMEKQHQEQLIVLISRLNDTASNRIDGMKRRYEQLYEELRQQSELNMKEMTAKMTLLAEQIAFERRVSMAQLVVVITLFVFMAISRGNLSILSPIMEAQAQERKRRESIDQASAAGKQQQQQDDIVPNKDLLAPPSIDAISESRRNSGERCRRWSGNSAGLGIETHKEQKQQQTNSSIATTTTAIPKASSSPVLTRRNSSGDAEVPTATFQNDFLATLLPHKTSI